MVSCSLPPSPIWALSPRLARVFHRSLIQLALFGRTKVSVVDQFGDGHQASCVTVRHSIHESAMLAVRLEIPKCRSVGGGKVTCYKIAQRHSGFALLDMEPMSNGQNIPTLLWRVAEKK